MFPTGRERIVNRGVNPRLRGLPEWAKGFREPQIEAINQIIGLYEAGVRMVVLDAPTGTGKTLIGETVRQMLGTKATYLCTTKSLQDQFLHDFSYARVLKGRGNYIPLLAGDGDLIDVTCEDCDGLDCDLCGDVEDCPYTIAKTEAQHADVSVLNTAYWLSVTQGPSGGAFIRPLTIVDEADLLERSLLGFVSWELGPTMMRRYGIGPPRTVTSASSWEQWFDDASGKIANYEVRGRNDIDRRKQKRRRLKDLQTARRIRDEIREGNPWVYTGDDQHVEWKPVIVDRYGREELWGKAPDGFWLLMSASVIDAQTLLREVGWDEPKEWVKVNSDGFPPENRPVFVKPVGLMTKKAGDSEKQKVVDEVGRIVERRQDEGGVLVHAVSYSLTDMIVAALEKLKAEGKVAIPIVSYKTAKEREAALKRFKKCEGRGVLIGPSLDRGIDLPDELCRTQVIVKVPYPSLGDRQVSRRMHERGGQMWYTVQTIRGLVQMTGRGMRHKEDHVETYVLDQSFLNLWSKGGSRLFPAWWRKAVVMEGGR